MLNILLLHITDGNGKPQGYFICLSITRKMCPIISRFFPQEMGQSNLLFRGSFEKKHSISDVSLK